MGEGKQTCETVPKSDYDLCDAENSNLRRHLLWAAQFLSREQQAELRERIRRPIEDGGEMLALASHAVACAEQSLRDLARSLSPKEQAE